MQNATTRQLALGFAATFLAVAVSLPLAFEFVHTDMRVSLLMLLTMAVATILATGCGGELHERWNQRREDRLTGRLAYAHQRAYYRETLTSRLAAHDRNMADGWVCMSVGMPGEPERDVVCVDVRRR